ncbi:MAG: FAD-binding oxidoreductase, partial [Bacteroidales bacterium]
MINNSTEQFISELNKCFDRSQIKDSELYRELYARDASYFSILPRCVVRPESIDQVIELISIVNKYNQHLTFRAGGTSLAGQTIGDGIICELRTAWKSYEVRNQGKQIWFEPGLTCRQLNQMLSSYHTKLGPDPASSRAAMMGGVLANNSSGMQAGIEFNSYRMLRSLTFVLANGNKYDSSVLADRKRF